MVIFKVIDCNLIWLILPAHRTQEILRLRFDVSGWSADRRSVIASQDDVLNGTPANTLTIHQIFVELLRHQRCIFPAEMTALNFEAELKTFLG